MIMKKINLKKAVSTFLVSAMVLSFGGCSRNSQENSDYSKGNIKYSLENIKCPSFEPLLSTMFSVCPSLGYMHV